MKRFRLIEEVSKTIPRPDGTPPDGPREKWTGEWKAWENDRVDYIDVIRLVARLPKGGQGGIPPDEMRRAIRILDALEGKTLGDVLELEDADWENLRDRVQVFPYPISDRRFIRFIDTVSNATDEVADEDGLIRVHVNGRVGASVNGHGGSSRKKVTRGDV